MRLTVVKADGSREEYLHTKVLSTLNSVLGAMGTADIELAEQLAEVVTYYVYHERGDGEIGSGEIHSLIKVMLSATGYGAAAEVLSEHSYQRRMRRNRVEVVGADINEPWDFAKLSGEGRTRWDKSVIVRGLEAKYGVERQSARAVAGMVEEKIFGMGLTAVPSSLIRQLVLHDAAVVMRANKELATA
jgi:transcriptional regulator NrdR family protein